MKKIIYSCFLSGLLLTGCVAGDYGIKPADPQKYGQEEAIEFPVIEAAGTEVVNYQTMAVDAQTAKVVDFTALEAPEEGKLAEEYKLLVADKYFIDIDAEGYAAIDTLASVVKLLHGPSPKQRTLSAQVTVDYVVNGQATLLKSDNVDVKVILPVPVHVSAGYWLVGDMVGWNKDAAVAFTKVSTEDGEPIFKIAFETTAKEQNWKVIPQENYDGDFWGNGVIGVAVDGTIAMSGDIVTASPGAGRIEKAAKYVLTINLWDCTFKINYDYPEYVYVPGQANGWAPASAPAVWSQNVDGYYKGFACLDAGFKFTNERNWDKGDYGFTAFAALPEGFGDDGGNVKAPEAAFYYLEVNLPGEELKAVKITSWGLIGDATPGGWDADTDMTWDAAQKCWKAEMTLKDGQIKFRANDAWDINLGGSTDDLSLGGDNILVTAGTYEIKLYAERTTSEKMYCTMTKVSE